ncbi:AGE family epimerase/isomerase [Anaerobaca lacustris]|uniref:AGE family epimerase/isomerase n=1 Tax=Anaerobaca lacustris TaxID=3044600 RepID=A0AAW6U5L3_9BACT|nr:AGE family epimerase/isomerase [Sedimentisphaerales bacterium M17dextr]
MRTKAYAQKVVLPLLVLAVLSPAGPLRAADDGAALADKYLPRLEKILMENIAPFWFDKSLDRKHGGYIINFGPQGQSKGPGTKMIVSQARTVWLFARLARAGYGRTENLEAAAHGYKFLIEKMWDAEHGGFYWEVDAAGERQLKPRKHLYGQAFALYAMSEYYLASGRMDVLNFATKFFHLLEEKAHDKVHGGYLESFEPDWTPTPAEENSYMGAPAGLKLMNTHLHLMEAMTTFYQASLLRVARERLIELINIESNAVVRKTLGACTDKYDRDWTARLDGNFARVSYGHDIENVWLLMEACDAVGLSNGPFMDLYETLWAYSLKYGYDETNGGFYYTGDFNRPADDREKSWWVQAEAIVSALRMYRATNDAKYLAVFEKTFAFIENEMVDWEHGEWHSSVTPDGRARGDKANPWKAGYHNGRAMIECIEALRDRPKP